MAWLAANVMCAKGGSAPPDTLFALLTLFPLRRQIEKAPATSDRFIDIAAADGTEVNVFVTPPPMFRFTPVPSPVTTQERRRW